MKICNNKVSLILRLAACNTRKSMLDNADSNYVETGYYKITRMIPDKGATP